MSELARATDPAASAWVSANAGSGKTHLLADRVTRLLLAGADPARILCLTYTNAAAAEMANRLFDRLGTWALLSDADLTARLGEIEAAPDDPADLARARTLFAQALETPGGLKIQTIHAFCQNVLSRFPLEAGVPPHFAVLEERSAAELMQAARTSVLGRAARGEATLADDVATLATRAADGRFAELLNGIVGDAERLRAVLERHGDDEARLFARLRQTLGVGPGDSEESVLAALCDAVRADAARWHDIAAWLASGSTNDKRAGQSLADFLAGNCAPEAYAHLRASVLTQAGEPRKTLATKPLAKAAPDKLADLETLQGDVVEAEERRKGAVIATLTEALVRTGRAVLAAYDREKRARGALDFDDLTRRTLALLSRSQAAAWVLYKLDGGLDHILIDEAQDTSPVQWRIVRALADEFFSGDGRSEAGIMRTLFAVGDEKQSIYSFQGADPEGFGRNRLYFQTKVEAVQRVFADVRPLVSRRSTTSVLGFVDQVFDNAGLRDGLSADDAAVQHAPHRAEEGRVEIWPTVKAPESGERDPWQKPVDAPSTHSAAALLAARIAEHIQGWLGARTILPGTNRPIVPGDIMILVRRRGPFVREMIRQLLDKGIAVAGADRMVLLDQIAIADLVALGRFALLPEDDLNLAALLKSPLVGLSEDDLPVLAHDRDGTLWESLRARREEPRFAPAHAFLAEALAAADFAPPFEFYARLLGAGGRRRLVARLGAEANDAIDEFLNLALAHEGAHPPSLESFLDWFGRGGSEIKRDMEQAGDAVRVMTVHGAKGLEANIVFVPDTAQVPTENKRTVLYTDDCVYYGVRQDMERPAITAAKQDAKLAAMREYRRLLYVALTRAREWLILCGYETQKGTHDESWYPALEAAAKAVARTETGANGETVYALGATLENARSDAPEPTAPPALPAFLGRPADPAPRARVLRPSDAAGGEEFLVSPIADAGAKRFRRGLLVHALLALLPDVASDQRRAAGTRYLARRGVGADEADGLIAETLGVLGDPRFAPLFAPGSRAEVTVTATLPMLNGARVTGQIDRLAVTDDAVLIADFKTNRPPPVQAEDTPALYLGQMALYRAALARLYPGRRIACALVWTDGARLMALPDSLLDAALAAIAARQNAPGASASPPP